MMLLLLLVARGTLSSFLMDIYELSVLSRVLLDSVAQTETCCCCYTPRMNNPLTFIPSSSIATRIYRQYLSANANGVSARAVLSVCTLYTYLYTLCTRI